MTAMCNQYPRTAMTMSDASNGSEVQEPAREVGDGHLLAIVIDPDRSVVRPIEDKEVIRNG
jgi:hypothetical protein